MVMEAVKWLRSEECGKTFGTIFINSLRAWSVISKPCHAHPPQCWLFVSNNTRTRIVIVLLAESVP